MQLFCLLKNNKKNVNSQIHLLKQFYLKYFPTYTIQNHSHNYFKKFVLKAFEKCFTNLSLSIKLLYILIQFA